MTRTTRALAILLALFCAGCAFSGNRTVELKLNILGSTIEWHSTAEGEYVEPPAP